MVIVAAIPNERPGHGSDRSGSKADPYRLFVGRDAELEVMVRALEEARAGRGRLLLLAGDPGIGKTRLADELAARASEASATVLWGRCWEAGGAPAFWPWVQAVRSYVRTLDPRALQQQMGAGAPYIARMIPELQEIVGGIEEPPTVDPEAARFGLFDATTNLLITAAAERPMVLLFDDLQAADEPSLLLLQFVARELTGARILIVATYRDVEVSWRRSFASALAELNRAAATRRIELRGLNPDEVEPFIEAVTGVSPPPSLVAAIHHRTEGNPLFVAEVARLLASEGRLERSEIGRLVLPEGIREVIRSRLDRLSSDCVQVLTEASVLGQDFAIEVLRRLASEEDIDGLLDEAAGARVLIAVPDRAGRFRFSHGLVRDSLYESIPMARRMELHRKSGSLLESLYGKDPEPQLAELAYHFVEAAPSGDVDKAMYYAKLAGDRASRLLAFEEAVRLYQMALDAHEFDEAPDERDRCALLVKLGDAQARAGEGVSAAETFLRAARLAKRLDLPDLLGRAALGYGGRFVWGRGSVTPQLVGLLRDALGAVPKDDSALRAMLMARLSCALRDEVDRQPRTRLAGEAVAMARRVGDLSTLAYTLDGQCAAVAGPENGRERLLIAEELIRVAESIGEKERAMDGHIYRLWPFLEFGNMPAVFAELEKAARLARELRQPTQRWIVNVAESTLALLEGRWQDAQRLILEARRSGERAERQAGPSHVTQTFALRKEQGALGEWKTPVERAVKEYPTRPLFTCLLANLYAELGDRGGAERLFETLADDDFGGIPRDPEWLLSLSLLVEVADFLEAPERARILYELLLPFNGLNVLDANEFCTGAVSRFLGIAASVLTRWPEAVSHFEEAMEMNQRMGAWPWLTYTQYDYGHMLAAREGPGDAERAASLWNSGLRTAREIGMVALEEKTVALLGRLGADRVGQDAGLPPERAGPTVFRREGEYWSITFEGDAFRLKDTKGLRYLAQLLAMPDREAHAIDLLVAVEGGSLPSAAQGRLPTETGAGAHASADAGEVLDGHARAAYRRRLKELREDLDEAEALGDPERAARAREEMDFLARELSGAVGLGGRGRKSASSTERARQSVTKAIKAAIDRIASHSPALARHLTSAVQTGTFCSYAPDPRAPISWKL
jgi:tetratricopeptide (TPR) repeat protein